MRHRQLILIGEEDAFGCGTVVHALGLTGQLVGGGLRSAEPVLSKAGGPGKVGGESRHNGWLAAGGIVCRALDGVEYGEGTGLVFAKSGGIFAWGAGWVLGFALGCHFGDLGYSLLERVHAGIRMLPAVGEIGRVERCPPLICVFASEEGTLRGDKHSNRQLDCGYVRNQALFADPAQHEDIVFEAGPGRKWHPGRLDGEACLVHDGQCLFHVPARVALFEARENMFAGRFEGGDNE